MNDRNLIENCPKAVVSVSEMAQIAGMSRSRFHDLIGNVFPPPAYLLSNRKPCYFSTQQQLILSIRQKGIGWNGQPVVFYSRKKTAGSKQARRTVRNHEESQQHGETVQVLRTLGLSKVNVKGDAKPWRGAGGGIS